MRKLTLQQGEHVSDLYVEHRGWLQRWLTHKLSCDEKALDLLQATFIRLMAKPEKLGDLREPRAYLTTIANGLVSDHWRRQSVEQTYLDALTLHPTEHQPSEEQRALAIELLTQLNTLLQQMKPLIRSAFLLSQLDGLTYRQIADQLHVSERTVKSYMALAMLHCLRLKNQTDN